MNAGKAAAEHAAVEELAELLDDEARQRRAPGIILDDTEERLQVQRDDAVQHSVLWRPPPTPGCLIDHIPAVVRMANG